MPRNSSSSPRSSYKPSNYTPISKYTPPPPASRHSSTLPPPVTYSMVPSIMGSMIQGFGFGAGSSIGHRAVDSVLGTSHATPPPQVVSDKKPIETSQNKCDEYNKLHQECLNKTEKYSDCDNFFTNYIHCIERSMQNTSAENLVNS